MFWIVCVFLILLYTCVLLPLYIRFNSDVILRETIWPNILEAVYSIVELCLIWFCFASLFFSFWQFTTGKKIAVASCVFATIILKYGLNYLISGITSGGITDPSDDILLLLTYVGLEVIQFLIPSAFALFLLHKKKKSISFEAEKIYKLSNLKNPVYAFALSAAVVMTLFKIISRIIFDLSGVADYFYSMDTIQVIWMIGYYLLDVLTGLLGYFMILLIILSMKKRFAQK